MLIVLLCMSLTFFSCTKKVSKNPIPSDSSISLSKPENVSEYMQQIKNKTGQEQIKAIFNLLDSGLHDLSADPSDSNYTYAINTFKQFLKTSISKKMTESELKKFSPNLSIFKVSNGRVIMYELNPSFYGEINSGVCAYYQTSINNIIQVLTLYEFSTKHIEYVYETNPNFLVVAGEDKYINPYFAYVDGFSIDEGKATLVPVLRDSTNSLWTITSNNGWIRRNSSNNIGTAIYSASDSKLIISSTDSHKLILNYDSDTKKYALQN